MQDTQRAQLPVLDPAHWLLAGLAAVDSHGYLALGQRHTHHAIAQSERHMLMRNVFSIPLLAHTRHVSLEAVGSTGIRGVVKLQQGIEQLGMRAVAVVTFPVVLDHQLPVGILDDFGLHRHLGIFQIIGFEVMLQLHHKLIYCGRIIGQADKDIATGGLGMHLLQREVGLVEAFPHVIAGIDQIAVQLVGPLMVRADHLGDLAFFRDTNS